MERMSLQKSRMFYFGLKTHTLELLLHKNEIDYKIDVRYNHNMEDIL